ncbi:hypothetical protein FB192DRAFT_1450671 [Mucor lusitanicus]|uniref:Uncharacterized protein n=2 Tax=Mucor circinelloides f. lusitanicus TaxID=29924 RepID=A0A168L9H7_MUCCL|nr:hypothetical protein FB192DRAFT_1450671 [Mucor lusitanicus]OAD03264.1 hypothetical protein MUCCIDRAFT_110121 [Mucor lusitanicus CBS 277.49]
MTMKRIEDLQSDEDVVQDKPIKKAKIASVSIGQFKRQHYPKDVNLKIKGASKQLSESKKKKRKYIQEKVTQFIKDKSSIKNLEIRRRKNLVEILPYIKEQLTDIYRLENEPGTFKNLKHQYLKKLFPSESSAIIFNKKYLKHHH